MIEVNEVFTKAIEKHGDTTVSLVAGITVGVLDGLISQLEKLDQETKRTPQEFADWLTLIRSDYEEFLNHE